MKVAIIGAGIAGTMGAYFLAKRGHEVTIYDREPTGAMACSRANGGQISVCNAETWNTWRNIGKGMKWMFQPGAPLSINPKPSYAKFKWLAGFLRHTLNGSQVQNTIDTIHLGNRSKALYEQIVAEEGIKFDQLQTGLLHVYTENESFDWALTARDLFEAHGVEYKPVDEAEIRAIDPALKNFKGLVGGIMTQDDWTGDPHMFCAALMKVMKEKYKVEVIYNAEVRAVDSHTVTKEVNGEFYTYSEYDHVILSNGHEIVNFSRKLGDNLNVYPVKGYSITIDGVGDEAPSVSLLDDDKKIVTAKLGSRFRVAGTAELAGVNYDIRRSRIDPLLNWVRENFPDIDTSTYTSWACLRPMNSNMMPVVRESSTDAVWYHGAHGHLGWTLSAATGELIADMIEKHVAD